ncbi:hypothetical protein N9924_00725 [bacterium]|nr:hypothetical protein [bacterium]
MTTKNKADSVTYDNTTSGLTAADLQAATDEVEGRLDTAETDIIAVEGNRLLNSNNLSDVASASTSFDNIKQATSDSTTGVIELATQAEVDAGTDSVRAVTPATLKAVALGQSLTTTGHATLPGGLIIQWGKVNIASNPTVVTFSAPFPTAAFSVTCTGEDDVASPETLNVVSDSLSTTGFSANVTFAADYFYIAVGH